MHTARTHVCRMIELTGCNSSACRNLHVYWWGIAGAAVSVGVQVVKWAVELLVGGLQQGRGAAAQRTWGADTQQSWRAPAQQSVWTSAHQSRRVSTQKAVAAASHRTCGAAVHEARSPQQRQGGLCQGSLQERETQREYLEIKQDGCRWERGRGVIGDC